MSKRPWFPLYVGDLLSDTMNFDATQFGGYIKILCHYWVTEEPMSVDEMRVASGLSKNLFQKSWPLLEKKFVLENGNYFNRRMRREILKAVDISDKRSAAGSKAHQAIAPTKDKQKPTQLQSQLHLHKKKQKTRASAVLEIPDFIDSETWEDFVQHRKEKRQALKPTTTKRILKDLKTWSDDGVDVNQVLITSIRNGWTGIFKPGDKKKKSTNGTNVDHIADNELESWAKRNGAPPAKQQAGYDYTKYRSDLTAWAARQ